MSHDVCASCGRVVRDHDETGEPGAHTCVETVEVPVTRRARVMLVGRLEWPTHDVVCIATETGRATLPPGTQIVLRSSDGAPFRSGLGFVRDDLSLDIWGIPAACHGDLLYRVEPP